MKRHAVGSLGALALAACQVLGGFEEYARDGAESAATSGRAGSAGASGDAGASFAGRAGAGSGGTASGGAMASGGADAGGVPVSGGGGGTSGGAPSGGTSSGGTSSGAAPNGGSFTGGTQTGGTSNSPTNDGGTDSAGMGGEGGSDPNPTVVIDRYPGVAPEYVEICAPVSHVMNPPTGGQNYNIAAGFMVYATPIPAGYFVHSLEHGGVALLYNCPGGCADEVARAEAWMENRPEDLSCLDQPWRRRALLAPDPALTTRWAVVAWGVVLRASRFDEAIFATFYDENYNKGPEDACLGEVLSPDACSVMPGGS